MAVRDYSVVEFFINDDDGHRCGYCKGSSGSKSDGMWAHSLTVQDYQDMIDRGWRRSGCYCYKPRMESTCCPQYTIKCEILDFQMSKSQKKVIKKVNRYLAAGLPKKEQSKDCGEQSMDQAEVGSNALPDLSLTDQAKVAKLSKREMLSIEPVDCQLDPTEKPKTQVKPEASDAKRLTQSVKGESSTSVLCKKAKLMRRERRLEKLKNKGLDPSQVVNTKQPQVKSLEEFLQYPANATHHLELRLVQSCPPSEEFEQTKLASFTVYKKYQVQIHEDEPASITEKQFDRFLVNSPLEPQESEGGVTLGSYHQQYWLDGQLIAVGVIDLLPYCVSSVYFYYDPDFSFLSLGTYAALREIAFTRELQLKVPSIKSYYMGFYIHSCPKMKYKGQYTPSKLLCPASYTWHPIERCRPLLDANKYCMFDQHTVSPSIDVSEVLVLYRRAAMPYWRYITRKPEAAVSEAEEILLYAKLVGPKCARRMLLYRSH